MDGGPFGAVASGHGPRWAEGGRERAGGGRGSRAGRDSARCRPVAGRCPGAALLGYRAAREGGAGSRPRLCSWPPGAAGNLVPARREDAAPPVLNAAREAGSRAVRCRAVLPRVPPCGPDRPEALSVLCCSDVSDSALFQSSSYGPLIDLLFSS